MINVAIVEDEKSQADLIQSHILRYGQEKIIDFRVVWFRDAAAFLDYRKAVFDLVFMDIVLPGINGLEASKKLRETNDAIVIVFVTNLANYAIRGYEVDALDFIIKPVDYDFFAMKMDKAVRTIETRAGKQIMLPPKRPQTVISTNDIHYVEVKDHDLVYHLNGKKTFSYRGSLKEAEAILPPSIFVRCSNSYLVNLRFVTEVKGEDVRLGGETVRLGRKKKKYFLGRLADYLGDAK